MQRGLDRRRHGVLPRTAFQFRHVEMGIEPGVEQGHELRRDAGVPAQRRPHVILRIGDMELPQKPRQRADERDVAPHQAGGEDERIVAVILGPARHDDEEAGFDPRLADGEIERLARRALERHVVEPDVRRHVCRSLRPDVVGALVDDAEAHVFQDRHAFG